MNFKELLELEAGYTRNEPSQLCVREAIEAAVVHLVVQGLRDKVWALKNDHDWESPVLRAFRKESDEYLDNIEPIAAGKDLPRHAGGAREME